jgi:hypothetical protein
VGRAQGSCISTLEAFVFLCVLNICVVPLGLRFLSWQVLRAFLFIRIVRIFRALRILRIVTFTAGLRNVAEALV